MKEAVDMQRIIYMILACLLAMPVSANAKVGSHYHNQSRRINNSRIYEPNNYHWGNNQQHNNSRLMNKINRRRKNLYINKHNLHWLNHKMIVHHNNPRILYHIRYNRRRINKSIKREQLYLNKNDNNDISGSSITDDNNTDLQANSTKKVVKHHKENQKNKHSNHKLSEKRNEIKRIYQELNKLHNSNLY